MKADSPFWIKVDIDGRGKHWRLAIRRGAMIYFPERDFEDYWYDDEGYSQYPIVEIEKPKT